jgi:hypothetical protein
VGFDQSDCCETVIPVTFAKCILSTERTENHGKKPSTDHRPGGSAVSAAHRWYAIAQTNNLRKAPERLIREFKNRYFPRTQRRNTEWENQRPARGSLTIGAHHRRTICRVRVAADARADQKSKVDLELHAPPSFFRVFPFLPWTIFFVPPTQAASRLLRSVGTRWPGATIFKSIRGSPAGSTDCHPSLACDGR